MKQTFLPSVFIGILACWSALSVIAEDRYQYLTWEITNGTIYPLDVPQPVGLFFTTLLKCHFFTIGMGMNMIFYFLSYQGILINGQFTGPTIEAISNDNILVNVINKLDEKFLITCAPISDYTIVASSRFTDPIVLTTTATLRYSGSNSKAPIPLPSGPATNDVEWSIKQARTIRLNLTANAARPNPQGSFHYGTIPILRTLVLANSKAIINGKLRYAVNGISHINPNTPLKLADWFNIPGVFDLNTIKDVPPPPGTPAKLGTSVIGFTFHDFAEIIFQNNENYIQSWHMDGSSFYVVGYGNGLWTPNSRKTYNLVDGITRHSVPVYANSWECHIDIFGQ
ncbi:L-ascorbate oxidase like [Glycine soja]|uniref:L-ascorbate oxidase like n=1 Tax=Glycine soja TaxID=3848 RepID=A0A0B2NVF4_GLYSO|nr:L-ascorbate oxidase like [Glycine soja]